MSVLNRDGVPSNHELCLTAVGGLIRSIHTVVVPVTHPHSWDAALGDGTLELVGGTCNLSCTGNGRTQTDTQTDTLSSLLPGYDGNILPRIPPNYNIHDMFITMSVLILLTALHLTVTM